MPVRGCSGEQDTKVRRDFCVKKERMSWGHGRYPCIYGEKTGGDGVKMEASKIFDTFLCVDLTEGTHTVEFRFEPQGQKTGICITAVCALILGIIACIDNRNRKRRL